MMSLSRCELLNTAIVCDEFEALEETFDVLTVVVSGRQQKHGVCRPVLSTIFETTTAEVKQQQAAVHRQCLMYQSTAYL
jgi:hypothetical protein